MVDHPDTGKRQGTFLQDFGLVVSRGMLHCDEYTLCASDQASTAPCSARLKMIETMIFQRMMRSIFEHRKQALERVFAAEVGEARLAKS